MIMARPLTFSLTAFHIFPLSCYTIFTVLAIISIFSMVTFLCAFHKGAQEDNHQEGIKKRKCAVVGKENVVSRFVKGNSISSKALLKMISWRKEVHHEEEKNSEDSELYVNDYDFEFGDDAIWKKAIIMGGKCQPLDYSGKIEYDCEGNLLTRKSIGDRKMLTTSKTKEVIGS